jgi:hypothetical protein
MSPKLPVAAVAFVLLCAGCSDGTTAPPEPTPASIALSTSALTFTWIGQSRQVTAEVRDTRGNAISGVSVTWASSHPNTATVTAAGMVTAAGNGSTTLTATTGGLSRTVDVTVQQQPGRVRITPSTVSLSRLGETARLQAAVEDSGGVAMTATAATWTSQSPSIVQVSGDGTVTAVAAGSAVIEARAGSAAAVANVVVSQVATAISISPPSAVLHAVGATTTLRATVTDASGASIDAAPVMWTSSRPEVATVSSAGVVAAVASGETIVRATSGSLSATASVSVQIGTPPPTIETIDPFLATPAAGAVWDVPVVVVRFLPTKDGATLDQQLTAFPRPPEHGGTRASLADVKRRIDVFDRRVKFMLEEGSRFRGYSNPAAPPSLGYRIVHYVTFYEPLPLGPVAGPCPPNWCQGNAHFPDYHQILTRVNAEQWVNSQGVKEFWVWGYHYGNMVQPESNMSSPTTGDISNSYRRNDDLPVYNRTYTVYGYNFGRAQNEAVHNHGHQLEAILSHADWVQNKNTDLFWKRFVGRDDVGWITGRAGWTHMPPNTTSDYDYHNAATVQSDIEDWRPDNSGKQTAISNARWRDLVYNWPAGTVPIHDWPEDFSQGSPQRAEAQWYIYWMQNMPGLSNGIRHYAGEMTNWWRFTAGWDAAIQAGGGLATVPNGNPVAIRNDFVGGILLDPGGGLTPGQTVTLYATAPIIVRVYDCGEPGASGCIMDPYTLTPGKSYRVIQHPSGPPNNLTIVER